jgi:hypothetical protein
MLNKKTGLIALLVAFAVGDLMAGDFSTLTSYNAGDVLVCFRKPGTIDMVVDAGPITTYTSATPNQRIPITQYTGTQLADVGTNSINWSAFTWLSDNMLFVTEARPSSDLNDPTTPWQAQSSGTQAGTVARMQSIPPGANSEFVNGPGGTPIYAESIATAVVEEDDYSENPNYNHGVPYSTALLGQYGGAFDGKFVGNPENTTASKFITSGKVSRSDFYRMTPTSGYEPGTWLGYFELSTNGAMTYVAYPSAIPVINSVSRSGNINTINYTSGLYGTYTLRGTNKLTAPVSTWPAITTLTSGDTNPHTTTDTTTDNVRFYSITAQ